MSETKASAQGAHKPEEKDLEKRIKQCSAELKTLLGKYELGLYTQPFLTDQGTTAARTVLVSTRGLKIDEKPETASDAPPAPKAVNPEQ